MAYSIDDSWDNCGPVARVGNACFGLYVRCGIWSARNLTDGFVPGEVVSGYGAPEQARKLVDVGLWEVVDGGYLAGDYLDRNPPAVVVTKRRKQAQRKQALVRDPALRDAVRRRDRDRCRYCGIAVRWADRKGSKGGTYDHVDPDGPNSFDNLVVSCRGCNSAKCDRVPEEAGMTLLPVPGSDLESTRSVSRSNPGSSRHQSSSLTGGRGRDLRAVPDWCGRCNKDSRMAVNDADKYIPCPTCHPNREAS